MSLINDYGHCVIPKGVILFRMGKINSEFGSFFALNPGFANNFVVEEKQHVDSYIVYEEIILLFMISHLNHYGFPNTAIIKIYNENIEQKKQLDDLDIKWRNLEARGKFTKYLRDENILGWLSTQENLYPLEVFLLTNGLSKIRAYNSESLKDFSEHNSLREIHLYPSEEFNKISLNNMKPNLDYILERVSDDSACEYSIFHRHFLESGCLNDITDEDVK